MLDDVSPKESSAVMNPPWLMLAAAALRSRSLWVPFGAALLLALSACNGTAVVTLTSTPSTDTFLTYRVGLASVQLQKANGRSQATILPAGITVDYSSAEIVYDDGSVTGIALTPQGAGGQGLGQVKLTLDLDPSNQLSIT